MLKIAGRIDQFPRVGREYVAVSLDETTSAKDVSLLWQIFNDDKAGKLERWRSFEADSQFEIRNSKFLQHQVFNRHHSETEMLRYIKRLESRDLSLTASMIPLGSCTMKLNAASEMLPVSWPEFAKIHPFAPLARRAATRFFSKTLRTGSRRSPASWNFVAAQRRFAGRIRRAACHPRLSRIARRSASKYLSDSDFRARPIRRAPRWRDEGGAGRCDPNGDIDLADLRRRRGAQAGLVLPDGHLSQHARRVRGNHPRDLRIITRTAAGLHGRSEHERAGRALTSPGFIGADVCHLNLHKTFAFRTAAADPGWADWRGETSGSVPAGHPVFTARLNESIQTAHRPGERRAMGQRAHPRDFVDVYRHARRGRAGRGDEFAILNANYISSGWKIFSRRSRKGRPGRARVHPGSARDPKASPPRTWRSG